jgi:hypothetical protein
MRAEFTPAVPPPMTPTRPGSTPGDSSQAARLCRRNALPGNARHDDRHPARDLAHRLEQGQPAIHLDRFISDPRHARSAQRLGKRLARREVQVGKKNLPGAEQRVFVRQRLLHFHNHLRALEDLGMAADQLRARRDIFLIAVTRSHTRAGLDEQTMPALHQLVCCRRQQRDAILLLFDFLGNADDHRNRLPHCHTERKRE